MVTLAAGIHSPSLSNQGGKLPTVTFRLSVKGNKDSNCAQGTIQVERIQATRSATIKHASRKESQDNVTVLGNFLHSLGHFASVTPVSGRNL
jgi:hypothetical protein